MLYTAHPGDSSGHAEKRQPARHGSPLCSLTAEHILLCGHIRREEEACDYGGDALFAVIEPERPAVDKVISADTRVAHNRHNGGQNGNHCNAKSEYGFDSDENEFAEFLLDIFVGNSDEEIEHDEENLAYEEPVVHHGVYCHGENKGAVLVLGDKLLHGDEQEREERRHVKEVVEEKIIDAVAGECVEKSSRHGEAFVLDEPCHIKICGYCGGAELEHEKRSHKIGNRRRAKGQSYQKERAEQQIEGVGADKICAEVGSPVPAYLTAFHKLVSVHIKAYLLTVIVAVICENSAVSVNYEAKREHGAYRRKNRRLPMKIFCGFVYSRHFSTSVNKYFLRQNFLPKEAFD